jgi:predicted nucleic-acid-binding protein
MWMEIAAKMSSKGQITVPKSVREALWLGATAFLASQPELYLADLIVAETVYVLKSFYKAPRDQVANAMRSLIAMRSMTTVDPALLLRAVEVYEVDRLDFAEAYLVACAKTAARR